MNSEVRIGSLLWKICYPKEDTGEPATGDEASDWKYQITFAYDRQGRIWRRRDQAEPGEEENDPPDYTVHEYEYDHLGRLVLEDLIKVRTGLSVDPTRIYYRYDRLGRVRSVRTSLVMGFEVPRTEVAYLYNGFGQVLASYQKHDGWLPEGGPSAWTGVPRVRYEYSQDSRSYLEKLRYPDFLGLWGLRITTRRRTPSPGGQAST